MLHRKRQVHQYKMYDETLFAQPIEFVPYEVLPSKPKATTRNDFQQHRFLDISILCTEILRIIHSAETQPI